MITKEHGLKRISGKMLVKFQIYLERVRFYLGLLPSFLEVLIDFESIAFKLDSTWKQCFFFLEIQHESGRPMLETTCDVFQSIARKHGKRWKIAGREETREESETGTSVSRKV